ncbi:MAG: RNA polymerase sigma factor [Bacteroidia bacterium]|nr:RNA polymerase sigma factor [Bacteroidia bacterium]MCZ2276377.1 RNA polymerase sigma factor [Bacteroidia bacterium]
MKILFRNLVQEEYGKLRSFALKLTHNQEEANDLVQETVYRAMKYEDKFVAGTNLKGWLYTIMKNTFINHYRRLVNSHIFSDNTDTQFYINSARNTESNHAEANLGAEEIVTAINNLKENLREPFMMSYMGFKYEEIAQQLNIPLGTVKIRIHTARQILKAQLAHFVD